MIFHSKNKLYGLHGLFLLIGAFFLQFQISLKLADRNYFNDDLEPIAGIRFFEDLYRTQLNVHFPGHMLVSKLLSLYFGNNFHSNRLIAAFVNCLIILGFFVISKKIFSSEAFLFSFITATTFWFLLENDFWAYLNLSQLHAAAFTILFVAITVRRKDQKITFANPYLGGFFAGMAINARVLQVVQISLILFIMLIYLKKNENLKFKDLARFVQTFILGIVTVFIFTSLIFHDRLYEIFEWSIRYNFFTHSDRKSVV